MLQAKINDSWLVHSNFTWCGVIESVEDTSSGGDLLWLPVEDELRANGVPEWGSVEEVEEKFADVVVFLLLVSVGLVLET